MKGLLKATAMRAPLGAAWGRSDLPAIAGLVLPMAVLTTAQGPELWLRFAFVLAVTLGLQVLFARIRRQPLDFSGVVTAGIVAIAVPAGASLYQLLLGIAFGVVIGEQVFGGRELDLVHATRAEETPRMIGHLVSWRGAYHVQSPPRDEDLGFPGELPAKSAYLDRARIRLARGATRARGRRALRAPRRSNDRSCAGMATSTRTRLW